MEKFGVNEYVWDCLRQGPAVVIGVDWTTGSVRYTVAEIILSSKSLGRVASRKEDELERYVNLAISESAAQRLLRVWGEERIAGIPDGADTEIWDILKAAMERRGIEPTWSP